MVSVFSETQLPNGKVRRRYQVSRIDLNGKVNTAVIGMFNHSPDDLGKAVDNSWYISRKDAEIEHYKYEIKAGRNPFLTDSVWNTRTELLKAILDEALSLPITDNLVLNGLPFVDLVTDDELATLYSHKDLIWIQKLRSETAKFKKNKDELDAYVPLL